MKQVVAPLQSEEVVKVRMWATEFETVQQKYREDFLRITPFQYECEAPYTVLDKVDGEKLINLLLIPATLRVDGIITNLFPHMDNEVTFTCLFMTMQSLSAKHSDLGNV